MTPTRTPVKKTSSGSKPNQQQCNICSKGFSNASALAKHRLTHSEERRYQCTTCSKAFKRQDHLNGHLLTHRSTKPFACLVEGCGKSYCDARSLRRHKENHHGLKANKDNQDVAKNNVKKDEKLLETSDNHIQHKLGTNNSNLIVNTKGLSAQQVQLIEQLFKDSKNLTNDKKIVRQVSVAKKTDASIAASNIAAKALAAVQNQAFQLTTLDASPCSPDGAAKAIVLAEKPVECTICSRKFKNIPALNGHMRLHGGYYKRDADGKRILNGNEQGQVRSDEVKAGIKRKLDEKSQVNGNKKAENKNLSFTTLPPPNTNQLLANLERKNIPQHVHNHHHHKSLMSNYQFPSLPVTLTSGQLRPQMTTTPSASTLISQPLASVGTSTVTKASLDQMMKVDHSQDKSPKIGSEHQAELPNINCPQAHNPDTSELVWDPLTASKLSSQSMLSFLTLSSSCLVPGGSRNEEIALQTLHKNSGHVQRSLLELMMKKEERGWSDQEVALFYENLVKHHKDFDKIAKEIKTRSVKECVEYYYMWKNICRDESRSFKAIFSCPVVEENNSKQLNNGNL